MAGVIYDVCYPHCLASSSRRKQSFVKQNEEYEGEKEASVGRFEEDDLPHEDSDDSLSLLFSVTVADTETDEIENEL